jgi:hypothetical protein
VETRQGAFPLNYTEGRVNSFIENAALSYAAKGWFLVPLHGVVEPKVCTCSKGADCGTPGKHPRDNAWHLSASKDEDEVSSWFQCSHPVNIGILLGPKSGVIDVELDGEEAEAAWNGLGLGEIWTPTYRAGRGPHRLFRWDEGLPAVQVKKPLGIEVRIGNDGKAAQSVLPPSRHHTGIMYEWISGLSPDDVELAPLPEKLVALLWNDDGSGRRERGIARSAAREMLHHEVKSGNRNNELHRFAVSEAFRSGPNLDDEREQQDLLLKLRAVNVMMCKPPLGDTEVVAVYRSAISWVRKNRSAGVDEQAAIESASTAVPRAARRGTEPALPAQNWQRVFTEWGLSYAPLVPGSTSEPEWGPGEWRLTVVHSDPIEYRLHVPAWRPLTADETGNVPLTVDQYRSAPKVAAAVLAATGTLMLDDDPKRWRKIWDGGYRVVDSRGEGGKAQSSHTARGVRAKLLDNPTHEWPGASSLRYVLLATWLYDRLSQASQPSDDDVPDPTGRASWRQDGTLWFAWGRVWEDIERQHRVVDGERIALKRRLLARLGGERDFAHREYRHLGGARKSYVVWSRREFAVLEEMATERTEEPVM